jgi:hypothetical protein
MAPCDLFLPLNYEGHPEVMRLQVEEANLGIEERDCDCSPQGQFQHQVFESFPNEILL